MPRETWTDERLDDLADRVEAGFAQVHSDLADLRIDNRELRREPKVDSTGLRTELTNLADQLRAEMRQGHAELRTEMNDRFAAVEARLDRMLFAIFGAILTGIVGIVVNHLG